MFNMHDICTVTSHVTAWCLHTRDAVHTNTQVRRHAALLCACRFASWTTAQCRIQDCVEAHTNVDIIVDVKQLRAMLDTRLPRVLAGASVPELASVWPSSDPTQAQPWNTAPGVGG